MNGINPLDRYGKNGKNTDYTKVPTPSQPAVSLAYDPSRNRPAPLKGKAWKIWLVGGDCVFIGMAPVLVHMSKNTAGTFTFSPITINLLIELAKTLFALGTLMSYGSGRPGPPLYRSFNAFLKDASHNRLLAIPAALYAVNNYLKFAMQLYFKPTTAKMLSNLKIIVIALLLKAIMRRKFSVYQWEALYLLVAGISVNQLGIPGNGPNGDIFSPVAIMYTVGSITIPSLASVYNEFALKKNMETSVLLQNFFLYFFGLCFNILGLLLAVLTGTLVPSSIFEGFTFVTTLLIFNNALQGILSSFFFKYADAILKKYSSTIATIFTGIMSAFLFGHPITLNFVIGVSIVFISMHIFFSHGGTKGRSEERRLEVSPSMDHVSVPRNASSGSLLSGEGGSPRYVYEGKRGVALHPMLPR